MRLKFINQNQSQRLILVYAGWAMDEKPFSGLSRPGYDVAVIWDYRNFSLDWSFILPYKEICVVAWSLGVYAATVTYHAYEHLLTKRIAINGTPFPVDRMTGIPPAIFSGTLMNLNERSLRKFYIRVCGGMSAYGRFSEHLPERDIAELSEELSVFLNGTLLGSGRHLEWDFAFISSDDAIFPPVNQWRAWGKTPVRFIEGAHLPDFQAIIDRYIIDKERMTSRFDRGFESYDRNAGVQARVVERVNNLLHGDIAELIGRRGARVLEIGSGTGTLSKALDSMCGKNGYVEFWDIAGDAPVDGPRRRFRRVDAEIEIMRQPSKSFDVIVSTSTIQWFNSPLRFLRECQRVVAPGGYVLLSAFVRGNLDNVTKATGRTLPLMSLKEWRRVMPEGFDVISISSYNDEMCFDNAVDVFRHLRSTGVDSLGRVSSPTAVSAIRNFSADLDGKYRICYKPIIMLMQRK